jgi:hypothetical protein
VLTEIEVPDAPAALIEMVAPWPSRLATMVVL